MSGPHLSPNNERRGADRIIRMSRTLADLAGVDRPRLAEIDTAPGPWLGTGM